MAWTSASYNSDYHPQDVTSINVFVDAIAERLYLVECPSSYPFWNGAITQTLQQVCNWTDNGPPIQPGAVIQGAIGADGLANVDCFADLMNWLAEVYGLYVNPDNTPGTSAWWPNLASTPMAFGGATLQGNSVRTSASIDLNTTDAATPYRTQKPRTIAHMASTEDLDGNTCTVGMRAFSRSLGTLPSAYDYGWPVKCTGSGTWVYDRKEPVDVVDSTSAAPDTANNNPLNIGSYFLQNNDMWLDLRAVCNVMITGFRTYMPGGWPAELSRGSSGDISDTADNFADAMTAVNSGTMTISDCSGSIYPYACGAFYKYSYGNGDTAEASNANAYFQWKAYFNCTVTADMWCYENSGSTLAGTGTTFVFDANGSGLSQGQWNLYKSTSVTGPGTTAQLLFGDSDLNASRPTWVYDGESANAKGFLIGVPGSTIGVQSVYGTVVILKAGVDGGFTYQPSTD